MLPDKPQLKLCRTGVQGVAALDTVGEGPEALVRFGVSMPQQLIDQFDAAIREEGYRSRSEAVRDLVRRLLLEPRRLAAEGVVAGTIVTVYDHHVSDLPVFLMHLQHSYHREVISTTHVHLNERRCLEVLVVRGQLQRLRELQLAIQVRRGVFYAELSVTHVEEPAAGAQDREGEGTSSFAPGRQPGPPT